MKPALDDLRARPLSRRQVGAMLLAYGATASSLALIPLQAAQAADRPVLTVSTNNTPLDRKALQALSEEAFRRAGVQLRLVSLPSERSLVAANQGEVDGEGLRVAGLEDTYGNLVRVPERYVAISFVAFARDRTISVAQGWDSLKPHRVAFINGWKMFESNAGVARTVNKVDKPEQLFQMLEHGRIDLALYTLADGAAQVRKLGLQGVVALSPTLKDVDMYLYLHRKHAALVPKIASALREMKADGSHQRILGALSAERE
jgi:polar amino acid transport system substrate-binding protein